MALAVGSGIGKFEAGVTLVDGKFSERVSWVEDIDALSSCFFSLSSRFCIPRTTKSVLNFAPFGPSQLLVPATTFSSGYDFPFQSQLLVPIATFVSSCNLCLRIRTP